MEMELNHFATKEGLWMLWGGVAEGQELGKPVEWVCPGAANSLFWKELVQKPEGIMITDNLKHSCP